VPTVLLHASMVCGLVAEHKDSPARGLLGDVGSRQEIERQVVDLQQGCRRGDEP
jgi:hypothetical protein